MNKIFILVLCLFCAISYFNCLQNDFVLDDEVLIVNNALIKSPDSVASIFKTELYAVPYDKMYRPLQLLSYRIDYSIWKLKPFGFHLTSVMLHLFNAILVFYLLNMLFNNKLLSMAASILFLVHPLNVSSVAYISGRADLLASFFMLISLAAFTKFVRQGINLFYVFSLLCGLLAILSRENSLLLFLLIGLILFILGKKPRFYLLIIPFLLINFGYFVLRFFIFGQKALATHPHQVSLFLRIINFMNIIPKYLSILVFPIDLHMFRTTQLISSSFDPSLLYLIGFVLIGVVFFIRFKTSKLLFSLVWFLVGLIPVFLLFDGYMALNKAVMAESWVYFSTIGFCLFFALIFVQFKKVGSVLFVLFVIFYMFLTNINNRYFKSNIILYQNILSYNNEANPLRKGLIKAYLEKGLYADAFRQIQEFGKYYPKSYDFYLNSGLYYLAIGKINIAIEYFNFALEKNKDEYPYYNLSICYEQSRQLDRAIESALKCYALNSSFSPELVKLGDLYMQKSELSEAKKYYEKALILDPDSTIIKNKISKLLDAKSIKLTERIK